MSPLLQPNPSGPGAAAATVALLLSSLSASSIPAADASPVVVPKATLVIKEDQYSLSNMLWDDGCPMTYDPALVDDVGAAFSVDYTDPNPVGGNGMDAYVSGAVGGKRSGGQWRPGSKDLTGMPVQIQDLAYDFRIRWKVSQDNARDADDKWWATINVIFDSGTEESEPDPEERLFDIVIQLDKYEQDDLEDVSSADKNTYWWFARNADQTLKPFVLNIDGQDYEWGVRYKFFQNQEWKNDKVHIKFIPVDNNNVAPYIDHPLRVFTEAATDYLQYVDLPATERARADLRVSEPTLWVKAISAGYETYTGSSTLRQDELRTVVDTTAPAAPVAPTAERVHYSAGGDAVVLDWPDLDSEISLHGYSVHRSDDGGASYKKIASDLTASSYVDDDDALDVFKSYQYKVKASDRSYNVSPSSAVVAVPAAWTSTTVPVSEDTFAVQSQPAQNYGSWKKLKLRSDGGSNDFSSVAYLKFDVTDLPAAVGEDGGGEEVKSATLRVYSITETDAVSALAVDDGPWSEGDLTWANRPSTDATLGSGRAGAAETWFDIDVIAGYVADGNGVYSIALDEAGGVGAGSLGTREGGFGAYLDIVTGPVVDGEARERRLLRKRI